MRRNLILVTTGAQGNNVVPRISLFFPFQGESLREMVGACHVSIDARELEVSSELARVSSVSGEKGKDGSEKRREIGI